MFLIMYYAGLVLAFIFLILSIVFFVKDNVAKLIGDVTGWNARKAIKKINKKGAEEKSKTEAINSEVSKVLVHNKNTGTIQAPLEVKPKQSIMEAIQEAQSTTKNSNSEVFRMEEDMVVIAGEETTVLNNGDEATSVLAEEETTLLENGDEATSVLAEEETTLLNNGDEVTSVLAEEETTLLENGDEVTSVLAGDETTILDNGDEATSILVDEETTLLNSGDEATSILAEEGPVVVADEFSSILNQVVDYSTTPAATDTVTASHMPINVETPLPDIFDVEEDTMVVHTDESMEQK